MRRTLIPILVAIALSARGWEDGWLAGAADPRSESAARGY